MLEKNKFNVEKYFTSLVERGTFFVARVIQDF
jgi:hypothetical protein